MFSANLKAVKIFCPALACAALFALGVPARAVFVSGGDGTRNTTPGSETFPFANVGRLFDTADGFFTSCVYLGSGWVLSAYHPVRAMDDGFQFGPVIFRDSVNQDTAFTVDPASATRLRNADSTFTDLALFRLTANPEFLATLTLASTTPAVGSTVILMGNGLNRATDETKWNVNVVPEPDVWSETALVGTERGYKAAPGQSLRWGSNTLESNLGSPLFNVATQYGTVRSVATDFDNVPGQAQAAPGDSGGALFHQAAGGWELLGILYGTSAKNGQPVDTGVYGNSTFAANLPTYRSQIMTASVPEPGTAGLIIAGGCWFACRRRRG